MPIAEPLVQRLALGTAQFGLAYGINNQSGQPSLALVTSILQEARRAGITLLDTAAAYGDSEARLGESLASLPDTAFQVVTKIAAAPAAEVARQLRDSLARLRRRAVYGVLFHNFELQQQHPDGWAALAEARQTGLVERIGVSLYHPWQVKWLIDNDLPFDLLQIPYNVLDQRFEEWLPLLARRGVEVHVRSVFLQGLLLRQPTDLPPFFAPLRPKLEGLRALAAAGGIPLSALLLLFAACASGVGRAVIGVDSVANLRENVAAGEYAPQLAALLPALRTFAEPEDTFLLPYTWPRP